MAGAAIISEPSLMFSLFSWSNPQFPSRNHPRLRSNRLSLSISICLRPSPPASSSCSRRCLAGTLDPEPIEESTSSNPKLSSIPNSTAAAAVISKEGGKDRRRAVRIAWEKLVRWSRSWRSKAKTDVLERTKKVPAL